MLTEMDFGYEYARWIYAETKDNQKVDIAAMLGGSVDIPEDEYKSMIREGIENPSARGFWDGYNSCMEDYSREG